MFKTFKESPCYAIITIWVSSTFSISSRQLQIWGDTNAMIIIKGNKYGLFFVAGLCFTNLVCKAAGRISTMGYLWCFFSLAREFLLFHFFYTVSCHWSVRRRITRRESLVCLLYGAPFCSSTLSTVFGIIGWSKVLWNCWTVVRLLVMALLIIASQ